MIKVMLLLAVAPQIMAAENHLYVNMARRIIDHPSKEHVELWLRSPDQYTAKRTAYLKSIKKEALVSLEGITGTPEQSKYLNSLPVDPFSDQMIVPPSYYKLWLFCKKHKIRKNILSTALKVNDPIIASNVRGDLLPVAPVQYLTMLVYEKPSKGDIMRWIKTNGNNKIRQEILISSFQYSQYDDFLYKELATYVIINDNDPTMRIWAANILISLPGGRHALKDILDKNKIEDALRRELESKKDEGICWIPEQAPSAEIIKGKGEGGEGEKGEKKGSVL